MADPTQPKNDPLLGQTLDGRYELTEFIAQGGMGRVYKATQWPLNREVAVKLLLDVSDGLEEFQQRFFLEASLCARLSHPNIIRIFDYGTHAGQQYYIAMEYLEGETLKDLVARTGPVAPRRAVGWIKQVCSALVEAHDAGLVHRDLKPSNLFITRDAVGGEFVKILDFGVVKQTTVDMEYTHAGTTLGSPLFMSPEQIRDQDLDGRSDLYSLGVVLFQFITGCLPFTAGDPLQVVMKHLTQQPPRFADVNPSVQVSGALEDIVQKALCKKADERFDDARAMLEALKYCEQFLPVWEPTEQAGEPMSQWNPDAQSFGALTEIPTGTMPALTGDLPSQTDEFPQSFEATQLDLDPAAPTEPQIDFGSLEIEGYVAFVDLNCPYCFALHERMHRWGLVDRLEWCMVEHASHVLDGPFDLRQEEMLSAEVFEVHHRAPDVELLLPPQRCRSTMATRLTVLVAREFPEQVNDFRQAVYRALWQQGSDIGERSVLTELLERYGFPLDLLEMCDEDPPELVAWQEDWEQSDFDRSIPVMTHPATGRVLIGLANESTLTEFFLEARARVVDSSVCYYQARPSILLCGWMSHLWKLLTEVRECCEILQAPTADRATEMLNEIAVPDLLVVEAEHIEMRALEAIAELARSRSVPWVVASRTPSPEMELRVLSMGAVEYLPVTDGAELARARLGRVMRDRYNLERVRQRAREDELTQLPTRRAMLEAMEGEWARAARTQTPLSFVLVDIDGFKPYNKAHGYLSGDKVLVQLAQEIRRIAVRPGDVLARFGGNEFAVLLPATAAEDARGIGEAVRARVLELRIDNRASAGSDVLAVSVGTATQVPGDEASLHALVDTASRVLRASRK